ncbi:unnamed protein product, partial [Sphacelaria rigidula]
FATFVFRLLFLDRSVTMISDAGYAHTHVCTRAHCVKYHKRRGRFLFFFILFETQAHPECVGTPAATLSPFFRGIEPPPPYRSMTQRKTQRIGNRTLPLSTLMATVG